jgi:hypothetical protein
MPRRLGVEAGSLQTPSPKQNIFDDDEVQQYYMTLASLIGAWLSERIRLETSAVKNALLTMAKDLSEASASLSGL